MEAIKGIAVSSGIVIGRALVIGEVDRNVPHRSIAPEATDAEIARFDDAVAEAQRALEALRDRTETELGAEPAKIFAFHVGLLHDPALLTPIRDQIRDQRINAERAVAERFTDLARQFREMGNEVFRQKANDVIDLERRLLARLMGESLDRLANVTEPVIVVAHELTPSQAAGLSRDKVLGFATDAGGRTSHTSIVARALEIPAVVGCQSVGRRVKDGDLLVVDGDRGMVLVDPDEETIADHRGRQERFTVFRAGLRESAALDSVTLDGTRIKLMGNIEFPEEVDAVLANGGDGVGLYRTEFLYLMSDDEPSEEQQFEAYRDAIKRLGGRPLTIRTLDLGADKYTQQRAEEPERNPFLGLRSIRYCLQNLPMFKKQLRAIMRASAFGPIRVMFPLVSTVMELRQTKMLLNDVCEELDEEGVEYDHEVLTGMMIEVPSAAIMAKVFATEVGFFSIGTNDLIQYTLAVDRGNERVANLYTGAHPAVLQLIKSVIRAARRRDIEVSICGEIAGEAVYTMLLIGLGLRTLSLVPSQIPIIKRVIRSVDVSRCERLARKVGAFDSERQVLNSLRDELRKVDPDSFGAWTFES